MDSTTLISSGGLNTVASPFELGAGPQLRQAWLAVNPFSVNRDLSSRGTARVARLLCPQSLDGLDPCRSAGRNITRQQCCCNKPDRDSAIGQGIEWADFEQKG